MPSADIERIRNFGLISHMYQYRVTKYDPRNRDEQGHYLLEDWTEFEHVGHSITLEDYEAVERAYVDSAADLLSCGGASGLAICSLWDGNKLCPGREGDRVDINELPSVVRSMLRGEYGCRLESGTGFVHVG